VKTGAGHLAENRITNNGGEKHVDDHDDHAHFTAGSGSATESASSSMQDGEGV
jgi:hypothetical protein